MVVSVTRLTVILSLVVTTTGNCNRGFGGASCVACAVGTYKSTVGTASCTNCPPYSRNTVTGSTTCTACSLVSTNSDCTSMTCAAGSTPQPGSGTSSLTGPCTGTQSSAVSSGTFSDGPGDYTNTQYCTWTINSSTPVVVSFSSFDLESVYDVIYIQRCTQSGVCDTVASTSWGKNVSTQEIALLTGNAPTGPKNETRRYIRSANDISSPKPALCGPTANPACTAAYGGYSGNTDPAPYDLYFGQPGEETFLFFDGNIFTNSAGPNKGFSNWIRIDMGGNVTFSTIVMFNQDEFHHQNYDSYYPWNVNVYASSTSPFNKSESVLCAGPLAYLWWSKSSLDAVRAWVEVSPYVRRWSQSAIPWQKVSKEIQCSSAVSGRYLYITYTPGTWTWPGFGEIQVYGNATANPGVLVYDPGPWVSNTGYMKVQFSTDFRDAYSGFVGSWTSTSQCTASPVVTGCNAGYTGPSAGLCTACLAGTYKNATGSALCSSCPADSNSPNGSTVNTACVCNAGFNGANGSTCVACVAGTYKNTAGLGTCVNCAAGTYSTAQGATSPGTCTDCPAGTYSAAQGSPSCVACPSNSSSPVRSSSFSACVCNIGYQGMVA